MKSGLGFPSYTPDAVWTAVVGSWSTDYPITNLGDTIRTSKVARTTSTAQKEFKAIFPAVRTIQLVSLIGHNITNAAAAFRIYAFSDNNPDPIGNAAHIIADSGSLLVWPTGSAAVANYRSIRPYLFSAPVAARSLYIAVNGVDVSPEFQAIDLTAWWEWSGIGYGFETGLLPGSDSRTLIGNAVDETDDEAARVVNGQIDYLALGATVNLALDFQIWAAMQKPFVFVEDYDTPASWARTALLVRNSALPPLVGAVYRHDRFQFRFVEHRR